MAANKVAAMPDAAEPTDARPRPLVVLPAIRAFGRALLWVALKTWPLVARGGAACGRMAWRHRVLLTAIAVRVLWVAALVLLVDGGQRLLQIERPLDPPMLRTIFGVGLGLCAATVLLAAQRRIRWAGVALGTAHGALVLVLM